MRAREVSLSSYSPSSLALHAHVSLKGFKSYSTQLLSRHRRTLPYPHLHAHFEVSRCSELVNPLPPRKIRKMRTILAAAASAAVPVVRCFHWKDWKHSRSAQRNAGTASCKNNFKFKIKIQSLINLHLLIPISYACKPSLKL